MFMEGGFSLLEAYPLLHMPNNLISNYKKTSQRLTFCFFSPTEGAHYITLMMATLMSPETLRNLLLKPETNITLQLQEHKYNNCTVTLL
jgi:hypothetical protein